MLICGNKARDLWGCEKSNELIYFVQEIQRYALRERRDRHPHPQKTSTKSFISVQRIHLADSIDGKREASHFCFLVQAIGGVLELRGVPSFLAPTARRLSFLM